MNEYMYALGVLTGAKISHFITREDGGIEYEIHFSDTPNCNTAKLMLKISVVEEQPILEVVEE
jgi:hypothetical protein